MINHNRKIIYICIKDIYNHFAVQQKLTQHCKPTILQLKQIKTEKKQLWIFLHSPEQWGPHVFMHIPRYTWDLRPKARADLCLHQPSPAPKDTISW